MKLFLAKAREHELRTQLGSLGYDDWLVAWLYADHRFPKNEKIHKIRLVSNPGTWFCTGADAEELIGQEAKEEAVSKAAALSMIPLTWKHLYASQVIAEPPSPKQPPPFPAYAPIGTYWVTADGQGWIMRASGWHKWKHAP